METNDTNINTSVNVHNNKKTIITEKEITNSFVSSLQKERSAETGLSFNFFYENLNDMFLKRKYRKIVYEITKKEKTFSKSNVINSIQLLHLKLNSAFQIVNKKLIKYSKNPFTNRKINIECECVWKELSKQVFKKNNL